MPNWDVICLSPHADDAALSLGGTLAGLGARALVVTLCGGPRPGAVLSPFAEELHRAMGLSAECAMAVRRLEDETALARLGVARREAGLDDAIYRLPDAYGSRAALLGGVPAPGDPLAAAVDEVIRELRAEAPGALLLAPLGSGHVDHVLVAQAARRSGGAAFYEDFPYPEVRPEGLAPFDLGIRPDLEARLAAIRAYPSQVPLLFGDLAGMERSVRAHATERLWR